MSLARACMWGCTAASAVWASLWVLTGLTECGYAVVGFAVLAFLWWDAS